MNAQWYIVGYRGTAAKRVRAQAENGTGYLILAEDAQGIKVALRLPTNVTPPIGGRYANYGESKRFESQYRTLNGLSEEPTPQPPRPPRDADNLPPAGTAMANCHGQYSIQREINHIIQAEYPKTWQKLIQSTKHREVVRQQLHAQSDQWCDYRANTCACEPKNSLVISNQQA